MLNPTMSRGVALAIAAVLAGCAVGPNYKRPDTPVSQQFAGAEASTYSTAQDPQVEFWKQFDGMSDNPNRRIVAWALGHGLGNAVTLDVNGDVRMIGILQDAVSHKPIGLYGIAKTLVGYLASTVGARIDVEHPISRFTFTLVFFHFHQVVLAATQRVLLARPVTFFSVKLLVASLVNAIVAVFLFPLLDRLRKPS